jgi:hypothetical protein
MRLMTWLLTTGALVMSPPAGALTVGDPVPQLSFTDIEGVAVKSSRYDGWVQVLTFADRESSEKMTEWLQAPGMEVARKYPNLRIAYLGFADMQIVPRLMRPVAEPILRRFNRRSQAQQDDVYIKAGVKIDRSRTAFHLVPDWDGEHLRSLGVADATVWRCWIAVNGRIVEAIDGNTPDGQARYVAAIGSAARGNGRPPEH